MTSDNAFQAHILIADHDETLRELLDVSLRKSHNDVRMVKTGQEAFDLMGSEFFNLAILELELPDMTALEILSRLKRGKTAIPYTMILSTKSSPDTIRECVEAGARDFVVKPFNLPSLVKRIGVILRRADLDRRKG